MAPLMLERALEKLLLYYLRPYVDGVSSDQLHVGVLRGSLELRDVSVRPEALDVLGVQSLRLARGSVGLIHLSVPWSTIYTGKVRLIVDGVRLELEQRAVDKSDSDLISELREAKRNAINIRTEQLTARGYAEGAAPGDDEGNSLLRRLLRKVLYNLVVCISAVTVSFASTEGDHALRGAAELAELSVVSTDERGFQEGRGVDDAVALLLAPMAPLAPERPSGAGAGAPTYKLVRLRRLGVRAATDAAGVARQRDTIDADYVLKPVSFSLRVADVQSEKLLRVRMNVATEEATETILHRSLVQTVVALQASLSAEASRLRALMVPPEVLRGFKGRAKEMGQEYLSYYGRQLLCRKGFASSTGGPLGPTELDRLQLLEDSLPTWFLAQQCATAAEQVGRACSSEASASSSFMARLKRRFRDNTEASTAEETAIKTRNWLTPEQREELLQDVRDVFREESVELEAPRKLVVEVSVGRYQLRLVDDRCQDAVRRALLTVEVPEVEFEASLQTEEVGQLFPRGRVEIQWGAPQADSASHPVLWSTVLPARANTAIGTAEVLPSERAAAATVGRPQYARLVLKFGDVLAISFASEPLEVRLEPGLLGNLLSFCGALTQQPEEVSVFVELVRRQTGDLLAGTPNARALQDAGEVARFVYGRLPQMLQLDVTIASPVVHIPVARHGVVTFSLGQMRAITPEACALNDLDIVMDFSQTIVRTSAAEGEVGHDIIQPFPVRIWATFKESEDETKVDFRVTADELALSLTPEAVGLLYCASDVVLSVISETDADRPAFLRSANLSIPEDPTPVSSPIRFGILEAEPALKSTTCIVRFEVPSWQVALAECDAVAPFARLRLDFRAPGLVLTFSQLPSLMELDAESCALSVEVLNECSSRWEPLLERFRFTFSFSSAEGNDIDKDVGDRSVCTANETCVVITGQDPLLINFTSAAVRTLSYLTPRFAERFDSVPTRVPSSLTIATGDSQSAKYRAVNISGRHLELHFRSRYTEGLVMVIAPTGSAWKVLDEIVLPHFVTAVAVRSPGGDFSEALPLERPGAVHVPGTDAVAELLAPGGTHRMLLLAGALRVHNQAAMPLLLRCRLDVRDATAADAKSQQYFAALTSTMTCDAALLGYSSPSHAVLGQYDDVSLDAGLHDRNALLLQPNEVCSLPTFRDGADGSAPMQRAWLSVRPAGLMVDFSAEVEMGANAEPCVMSCPGATACGSSPSQFLRGVLRAPTYAVSAVAAPPTGGKFVRAATACLGACAQQASGVTEPIRRRMSERRLHAPLVERSGLLLTDDEGEVWGSEDVYLFCEPTTRVAFLPNRLRLFTAVLRPSLSFLNALPNRSLTIRYTLGYVRRKADNEVVERAGVAQVPGLTRLNLYNRPRALLDDLHIRARLEDGAPWSEPLHLKALATACATETMSLWERQGGAAAGIAVEPLGRLEVRFSCPVWYAERCGLTTPFSLEVHQMGAPLPCRDGITLLPARVFETGLELSMRQRGKDAVACDLHLAPHWSTVTWNSPCGPLSLCAQTEDIAPSDTLGAQCQLVTLRPRLVLTNTSDCALSVQNPEGKVVQLEGCQSMVWHWIADSGSKYAPHCALRFQPRRGPSTSWSGVAICGEPASGATPFMLPAITHTKDMGEVWTVEVAPSRGALAVSFREGSDFVAVNKTRRQVIMGVRPHGGDAIVQVAPGCRVPYGWPSPFGEAAEYGNRAVDVIVNGHKFVVVDVTRTVRRRLTRQGLILSVARVGEETILMLEENGCSVTAADRASGMAVSWFQVEVKLSQLGVSLVSEEEHARELAFCYFELIRMQFRSSDCDMQQLKLSVSEAQIDCQLPGRSDGNRWQKTGEALGLAKWELPAVIFANCAVGDQPFLVLLLRRTATSSRDILVQRAELTFDALDVTIDSGWLDPLMNWLELAFLPQDSGPSTVAASLGRPITEAYAPPPLPSVVQVEALEISSVDLTVWCDLQLCSIGSLKPYIRAAVRVLSVGDTFTVDGARLRFEPKSLSSPRGDGRAYRGSLDDFRAQLLEEYTANALSHAARVLGKSSLLRVPRVVLRSSGTAIAVVSAGVSVATEEIGSWLTWLTFDRKYIARQQRVRREKQIDNLGAGMLEAGRSLAEGFEGVFDLVRLPIRGAKKRGVYGFFGGVGRGIAGTVVKPVSMVGQAISEISTGVAAQLASNSASGRRRQARVRKRQPRLLFSHLGAIRPWCEYEAELPRQLGDAALAGIEEVVPLSRPSDATEPRTMLLLFPDRLVLANIKAPSEAAGNDGGGATGDLRMSFRRIMERVTGAPTQPRVRTDDASPASPMSGIGTGASVLSRASSSRSYHRQLSRGASLSPEAIEVLFHPLAAGAAGARELRFSELRAVHMPAVTEVAATEVAALSAVLLEDASGVVHTLPLPRRGVGEATRVALIEGLRGALAHPLRLASWAELRTTLQHDTPWVEPWRQRRRGRSIGGASAGGGAGVRVLEVFEVERRRPPTGQWRTPFAPLDQELSWRWVDASGQRHPQLTCLDKEAVARSAEPPCEPQRNLFEAVSPWVVELHEATDELGWCYSMAWSSSVWDAHPRVFHAVRKRRWSRRYA